MGIKERSFFPSQFEAIFNAYFMYVCTIIRVNEKSDIFMSFDHLVSGCLAVGGKGESVLMSIMFHSLVQFSCISVTCVDKSTSA